MKSSIHKICKGSYGDSYGDNFRLKIQHNFCDVRNTEMATRRGIACSNRFGMSTRTAPKLPPMTKILK